MRRSFYCLVAVAFTVYLQFFLVQSFTTTTVSLSRELKRNFASLCAGSRRKQSRKKEKKKNQGSSGDADVMYDNGADDVTAASLTTFGGKQQPNRRERMELILDRDGCTYVWCRTPLTIDTATTDHLLPKIKGGPSWIENELASCRTCNKKRGHTMPLEWLDECGHGDANRMNWTLRYKYEVVNAA
mmetsp:Transcript_23536/g.35601  ORF Transcript_23536/g.35601 Transcript_23536/m.35601 type:complete len:186 (-) Transcript_23536:296-853(-)